jgi:membrane associated rhomboid family serine protease
MYGSVKDDFKNVWSRPNNAVVKIIIVNVIVFALINILHVFFYFGQNAKAYDVLIKLLALPSSFDGFLSKPWTLITYMFLHEGFLHILFNMLFIYWFGRLIQEYLGSNRVISLYVLGGIFGGLFYMLLYNLLPNFAGQVDTSIMMGASAGVFALVVGAAVFMPNYTFYLLLLGPVRIKYIAIFYVFLSFIRTTGTNAGGEFAHLGGAIIGWLFIAQLQKGNDMGAWIISTINFFKSFFVRQPHIKVSHRTGNRRPAGAPKSSGKPGEVSQEEIDAILDKISQSGYESLSKDEKQKLFNAGK